MWYMVAGVLAYVAVASLLQPVAVARLIYGPFLSRAIERSSVAIHIR